MPNPSDSALQTETSHFCNIYFYIRCVEYIERTLLGGIHVTSMECITPTPPHPPNEIYI